jgi:lysophospholipase L1-like esterase
VNTTYPEAQNGIDGRQFSGLARIDAVVAAALPLDVVIIMLGTNDARSDVATSSEAISRDITAMVERISAINGGVGTSYTAPKVLVVAPPAVGDTTKTPIGGIMQGAQKRSADIASAIVAKGAASGFRVFDASRTISVKSIDGVHFLPEDHLALGSALASEVSQLLKK